MLKSWKILPIIIFFVFIFVISSLKNEGAYAACNPRWTFNGTTDRDWSVTYHLTLTCAGSNNVNVRVTNRVPRHSSGQELQFKWEINNAGNNNPVSLNVNGSTNVDLTVKRERTVFHRNGDYAYVVLKASNGSNDDDIFLIYNVDNKPDIEIIEFTYPGGNTCLTSDVTLRIKNTGWEKLTGNFDVRVSNGNGFSRTKTVSQNMDHNDIINISGLFTKMPRPPARAAPYTARAAVDTNNNQIREEGEGNNTKDDNYTTSACPVTPPPPTVPPSTYSINGAIYIDTDDSGSITSTDTRYTSSGTITIEGTSRTDNPDPSSGTYSIAGNANGTYSVSLKNIASGYTIISANPRSVTINEANSNNNNFLVRPPGVPPPNTYSIDGAVFIDSDPPSPNGIRSGTEPKIAGTFRIIGPGINKTTNSIDGENYVFNSLPAAATGTTYTIYYQSLDIANYRMTYPTGGVGNPSFTVTVGPVCNKGTHNSATCITSPSSQLGSIRNLNFGIIGITPITGDKWIQGVGGDMRSDRTITNIIPGTTEYFSQANSVNPVMTSGIVFLTSASNLGSPTDQSLKANENAWLITGSPFASSSIKTSYQKVKDNITKGGQWSNQIPLFDSSISPCGNPPAASSNCTLPSSLRKGLYTSTKPTTNLSFNPGSFAPNNDYIFMIEGNLNIGSNFTVPKTTTVFFIVKGDITVAEGVTNISGIYSTDKSFIIKGTNGQLFIEGTVIVNAGKTNGTFTYDRDLGTENLTKPAVQFIYRPDFILNAPELMRYSNYIIKEVAPGE